MSFKLVIELHADDTVKSVTIDIDETNTVSVEIEKKKYDWITNALATED